MSMTPGPWQVGRIEGRNEYLILNDDGVVLASVQGRYKVTAPFEIQQKPEETAANAFLMAASPEMLDLLKYFHGCCHSEDIFNFHIKKEVEERLDALLRRIEGEESA